VLYYSINDCFCEEKITKQTNKQQFCSFWLRQSTSLKIEKNKDCSMSWHRSVSRTRAPQLSRNNYYNPQPSLPDRTSPVVYVRLNQTFNPNLS
jgi:hypothetical protein